MMNKKISAAKADFRDRIWVWGGPYGSTNSDDCLLKGAEFFGVHNVIYMYGMHSDRMLSLLKPLDKVVCQLGSNCRNAEAAPEDTIKEAEQLSELSLRYPNIVGAMIDDFDTGMEKFSSPKMASLQKALRSRNPKLRLHVVTYTHCTHEAYDDLLPYIDVVTVWVWNSSDLKNLDVLFRQAREEFSGKPMFMGIFLHDYGRSFDDFSATPLKRLKFQFDKVRTYLAEDLLQGVIVLGDREITKHPRQAAFVRDYLARHLLPAPLQ